MQPEFGTGLAGSWQLKDLIASGNLTEAIRVKPKQLQFCEHQIRFPKGSVKWCLEVYSIDLCDYLTHSLIDYMVKGGQGHILSKKLFPIKISHVMFFSLALGICM